MEHVYNSIQRTYKVVRSSPDERDLQFSALSSPVELPPVVDLRPQMPPVWNQSTEGACTGFGIAAALEYDLMRQGKPPIQPSQQFIYYNERLMEGDVDQDAGAQIRDGIKSVATTGFCSEALWPYDVSKFTVRPPEAAYAEAAAHKALTYYAVDIELQAMKQALAQGYPVVAGISVFASFESNFVAATGQVPMPVPGEPCLGGHCVLIVGYDTAQQHLIVRNSWGPEWGLQGYFLLPNSYVNPGLMIDLWVITAVA